jgi:hypothetical protein
MRIMLKILFTAILLLMLAVNLRASLAMNILDSFPLFGVNPWAVATLYDAYCGFLTFYVWVAYKERQVWARVVWFVLIMGLGNIAMSIYALKELFKLKAGEPAWAVLQRRPA